MFAVGIVILGEGVIWADKSAYPRPELLIEASQLAKLDVAKKYLILDARDRTKYKQGHVPNARWVDQRR